MTHVTGVLKNPTLLFEVSSNTKVTRRGQRQVVLIQWEGNDNPYKTSFQNFRSHMIFINHTDRDRYPLPKPNDHSTNPVLLGKYDTNFNIRQSSVISQNSTSYWFSLRVKSV